MAELFFYRGVVVRVVDGDTADFDVDLGFHIWTRIRARMLGINAPEHNAPGGSEATANLRKLLPVGDPVTLRTFKDPGDKYGRWLAKVATASGQDVSDAQIAGGFAVPFLVR